MDDILSQIIAYAPDRIDTELKARALVQAHGTCTHKAS
jgi:hypothetical protein